MRDFTTWLQETGKELNLPPVEEGNATRRSAVRGHAYPPLYGAGQYPPADNITHSADAVYYLNRPESPSK